MHLKAIFLDFYGTLVHEDDEIIPGICEKISFHSPQPVPVKVIGDHWWQQFFERFSSSYGTDFKPQRELELEALRATIAHFKSDCNADEIVQPQFQHWMKPGIYEDTLPFLREFEYLPMYILSNIDTSDIKAAMTFHDLKFTGVMTSEDVRAYKPRPELFETALEKYGLAPEEAIHIGDSLRSDIEGAGALGIQTIWLNRLNKQCPESNRPNFICKDLNEAREVIYSRLETGSDVV